MDLIKQIYLNDNYNYLDVIILTYKEKYKSKEDLEELSAKLNIPVVLLQGWIPGAKEVDKKPEAKINKYIALFYDKYKEVYGKKYVFLKKEIGALDKIKNRVDIKEWDKIVKLIFYTCKKYDKGVKLSWAWNCICEDVRPTIILSKINYLLKEIDLIQKARGGKRFRDDTKKDKK